MTVSRVLAIVLFTGLIGLALFDLRVAVVAQSSYSGLTPSAVVRKYQQQPGLLVAYGRQAMLARGHLQDAEHYYQRALISNPWYVPAWLALGELRNDEGRSESALAILEHVDGLLHDVSRWRWDKAMLAYQLNRVDILEKDLAWLLAEEKISGRTRQKAVKLAFSLWPEPDRLVDAMGRENIGPLFRYAVNSKNIDVARYLWPLVDQKAPEQKQVLRYVNLLIHSRDIPAAARVWHKYFPGQTLLYNGDFSSPPVQGGFGWWIGKVDGVTSEIAENSSGATGLHLHFTGKKNVNFSHVSQAVPLEAGRTYRLEGQVQTRDLSTDQRPFIEVIGLYCTMKTVAAEMMPETQEWNSFTLEFTVPEQCNGVHIRIRRKKSNNLDNRISGDLWLTGLSLQQTAQQPSALKQ